MVDAHRIFRQHMTAPVSCPWRFDREGAARPRLASDGVAGMSVRINDDWHSWKGWALDKTLAPHGPMLFEMTHFTDLCNWFLAAEPEEVVALDHGDLNHGIVVRYRTGEVATIAMCAPRRWPLPPSGQSRKGVSSGYANCSRVFRGHPGQCRRFHGSELRKHPDPKDKSRSSLSGWNHAAARLTPCTRPLTLMRTWDRAPNLTGHCPTARHAYT